MEKNKGIFPFRKHPVGELLDGKKERKQKDGRLRGADVWEMRRAWGILLSAAVLFNALPFGSVAASKGSADGLCEHHPEHTAECGYAEAQPCTHEHGEECYKTVTECVHEHTDECYPETEESTGEGDATTSDAGNREPSLCTHVCSEESGCVTKILDCHHEHDESCGYQEAQDCGYVCEICNGTEPENTENNAENDTEDADLSRCKGEKTEEQEKTGEKVITAWEWIDPEEYLTDGMLALPGAGRENPAFVENVTALLPEKIQAKAAAVTAAEDWEETEEDTETQPQEEGMEIALTGWECASYPEDGAYEGTYTFTASLSEGFVLAEDAAGLEVKVELGGAEMLAETESVSYQEASWNGSEVTYTGKTENCTVVESSIEAVTWNAGWYVVNSTVTITEPITVTGAVNLILGDGCTLNAEKGIVVTTGNSLTIYAQSGGTGTLNATGVFFRNGATYESNASAGIGGSGTATDSGAITIHGGVINATGGGQSGYCSGAGIGGGSLSSGNGGSSGAIIIYDGTVTVNSGAGNTTGAGIGGGGGGGDAGGAGSNITIYGGSVTAASTGTQLGGAGIGGGAGSTGGGASSNIQIYGGTVNATGGNLGAGIGGGGSIAITDSSHKSGDGAVIISGGTVTAVGGNCAAGIGGGGGYYYKNEYTSGGCTGGTGSVTITGGIVDASSPTDVYWKGYEGAPIGNGGNAGDTAATVTIANGYAVYQDGAPVNKTDSPVTGMTGAVTVKACGHDGVKPVSNNDGTHKMDCPYCGYSYSHNTTLTAVSSGNTVTLNGGCGTCDYSEELGTVRFTFPKVTYGQSGDVTCTWDAPAGYYGLIEVIGGSQWQFDKNADEDIAERSWTLAQLFGSTKVTAGGHKLKVSFFSDFSDVRSNECELDFTIDPAPLTPSITGTAAKPYDGTTDVASDQLSITLTGVVNGDTVTATATSYAYDNANAGENKTITASGITLTGADAGNYTLTSTTATTTGTITKSQPAIVFASGYNPGKDYDGQAIPNPTADNLTITGANFSDVTFTWSATPKDAGTYTLTAAIPESTNTEAASDTLTVTISPKAVTPAITITPGSYEYTGSAICPSGSAVKVMDGDTVIPDSEYTLSYGENTQAGNGSVTVTDKANGNYTIAQTTETFTITKANQDPLTITGAPGSVTYGDTFQLGVSGGSGSGAVSWAASGATVDNAGNVTITRAGTVIITAAKAGDSNYSGTEAQIMLDVSKKALTVSGVDAQDRAYDGTNKVAVTAVTLDGIVDSDAVEVDLSGVQGTLSSADAGTYTAVTLPQLTLTGADSGNYTLVQPQAAVPASVTVTPLDAVITVGTDTYHKTFGDAAFPLDVTDNNTEADVQYAVTEGADVVSVSDGTVTIRNAGTAVITVSLPETANYNAAEPKTITVDVAKAAAPAMDQERKQYVSTKGSDGETAALDVAGKLPADRGDTTYTFAVTGDSSILSDAAVDANGTLTYKAEAGESGATASITVTAEMTNYENAVFTLEVELVDVIRVKITAEAEDAVYDGGRQKGYADGITCDYPVAGYAFAYAGRGGTVYDSSEPPVDAGSYTVTVSVSDPSGDYEGDVFLAFTIEKASIIVKADNKAAKTGEALPELTYTVSGLAGKDKERFTAPEITCDAADTKTAGTYPIRVAGAKVPDTINYKEEIFYENGTLTVLDSAVHVTGVSLDKSTLSLTVGGTGRLAAAVSPENATDKSVSWSSGNAAVASVDGSGNVTAVRAGTAVITATTADGGHTASCTVTVRADTGSSGSAGSDSSVGDSAGGSTGAVPGQPFLKDSSGREGWDVVRAEAVKAAEAPAGGTVAVDMNGAASVPGSVFEAVRGKDVTLSFDMGGGITWSVNGKDVTAETAGSTDFSVKAGAGAIPEGLVEETAAGLAHMELSLAHEGAFGFTATLTVRIISSGGGVTIGSSGTAAGYTGMYANLFYYNPGRNILEFVCAGRIREDGTVDLPFAHASDYTLILSASPMGDMQEPAAQARVKSVKLSKTLYTYDGKAKKPSVVAVDTEGRRISGKYYTVSYQNNKKVGKAAVTIKFKGGYSGTVKKTFTIRPAGTSIQKLASSSGGFTVKWKKKTAQTSGYQIQYSANAKFKGSSTRSVLVKNHSQVQKTVKNLKAQTKYYVRIRTYKTVKVNGKNIRIYSAWSKARAAETLPAIK